MSFLVLVERGKRPFPWRCGVGYWITGRLPAELVRVSSVNDERDIRDRKDVVESSRADGVELAYAEVRYFDPKQQREVFSRLCVARGSGMYSLITFDYWVEDAAQLSSVWDAALGSLIGQIGGSCIWETAKTQ